MGTFRISQLAERFGLTASTLRFYDRAGLLPADRSPSGYRLYGERAVDRLRFIQTGKQLGLGLEEIAELLTVWQTGACREVKADLRPRLTARIDRTETQRSDLAAFVSALRTAVRHLDAFPDRSDPCDPECCDFLHLDTENARAFDSRDTATHESHPTERWREAPVACALDAEAIGDRTAAWRQILDQAVERKPVPDGVRLTIRIEHAARAAELAVSEQSCCPFFDFQLHLDGPHAYLTVRAPEQGRHMLADLFAAP